MGTLDITKETKLSGPNEIAIINITGSLDAHTAPQMDEILSELVHNKKNKLLVNFIHLEYISSAGMGLFVGWIDTIRDQGGDIHMIQLKPNVMKVFQILGFDKIFKIFKNEKDAIDAFL
ncbi:MAG: STAS domain-containing protein [bacterium]